MHHLFAFLRGRIPKPIFHRISQKVQQFKSISIMFSSPSLLRLDIAFRMVLLLQLLLVTATQDDSNWDVGRTIQPAQAIPSPYCQRHSTPSIRSPIAIRFSFPQPVCDDSTSGFWCVRARLEPAFQISDQETPLKKQETLHSGRQMT